MHFALRSVAITPDRMRRFPPAALSQDLQVYLATELYSTGGHTAVIADYIAAQPGKKHRILITDFNEQCDREAIATRFAHLPVEIRWGPSTRRVEAMHWVLEEFHRCPGARTFLFNHHIDSASIAAATAASKTTDLYYCHHADHHLALGVHMEGATHIDLSPFSFHHCRDDLGVRENIYIPLTADISAPPSPGYPSLIKTACCGSPTKFNQPYAYSYFELLPSIISASGGSHTHIGFLDDQTLEQITGALEKEKIDPTRFIYVPHTPCLWKALQDHEISLYITSFPITGYKAGIEVMAAGIPVLVHDHYSHEQITCRDMLYPGALTWRTPKELIATLKNLTPELLADHRPRSRAHFDSEHSPARLAEILNSPTLQTSVSVPASRQPFTPDLLRTFLDQRVLRDAANEELTSTVAELKSKLKTEREKLAGNRLKTDKATRRLAALTASLSWRITKPLRSIQKRLSPNK